MKYLQWVFVILIGLTFGVELEWIGPRVLSEKTLGIAGIAYIGCVLGWVLGRVDAQETHQRTCPYEWAMRKEKTHA